MSSSKISNIEDLLNDKRFIFSKLNINDDLLLNVEKIEGVLIDQGKITIRIKFISEQFKNNDESTSIKKEDIWSFEKLIKSKNPNWLLSST